MISAPSAAAVWLANYEPGVPHQPALPVRPFHAFLEVAAATAPGFPAVTFLGRTRSYGELFAHVGRAAGAMARDGVLPGSVVLVALPSCPAQIVAIYAALAVGAVALVVDPDRGGPASESPASTGANGSSAGSAAAQMAELLASHDPALAVVHSGNAAVIDALEASRTQPRLVAATPSSDAALIVATLARFGRPAPAMEGATDWKKWLARARAPVTWPEVALDDPALAVVDDRGEVLVVPHRQATAGAAMLRSWLADARPGGEKWLLLRPLADLLGVTAVLGAAVELQAELVLLASTDEATVEAAFSAYRPTFALASDSVRCPHTGDESLRAWITDGEATGAPVCRGWSPTGAAGLVACNPVNGHHAPGTVGMPLPGAFVRALDERGETALPGVAGRLEVRAPNMPWPEQWLDTGVVGSLDERGYITLR